MLPKIFVILSQCIIFYTQCDSVYSNPLSGTNRNVGSNEYSFIVAIMHLSRDGLELECTGTVVSGGLILTAAHCLNDKTVGNIKVIYGTVSLENCILHNVSWWMTYNEWIEFDSSDEEDTFEENDLAIMQMQHILPSSIVPASLSDLSYCNFPGIRFSIFGWHFSNENLNSGVLKTATVNTISSDECRMKATNFDEDIENFEERFFCTTSNTNSFLDYGDSGGPLLYENKIVAINVGTCQSLNLHDNVEKANFHINLEFYKQFILDSMDRLFSQLHIRR